MRESMDDNDNSHAANCAVVMGTPKNEAYYFMVCVLLYYGLRRLYLNKLVLCWNFNDRLGFICKLWGSYFWVFSWTNVTSDIVPVFIRYTCSQ